MLLQSLSLKNIRSHEDTTISFEEGLTLLAGDIGAGKSTLLLAIEFALFGIRAGDVSGEALLRHGTRQGEVTLGFRTDRDYEVTRVLKRGSTGVRQDSGLLVSDGLREELTANELKARVLALLGYPEDLVNKRKGFVFRYTVYTPQEEMKHILFERPGDRLDTLRSVFGVDKYRVVQENAELLGKRFRDDSRFLRGQLDDVPEREEALATLKERYEVVLSQERAALITLQQEDARLEQLREAGKSLEVAAKHDQARKERLASMKSKEEQLVREQERLQRKQASLQELPVVEPVDDPSDSLEKNREQTEAQQAAQTKAETKQEQLLQERRRLEDALRGVTSLEECPRCQQRVTEQHKDHLRAATQEELDALTPRIERCENVIATAKKNREKLRKQREQLLARQRAYQEYLRHVQDRARRIEERGEVEERLTAIKEELADTQEQVTTLKTSTFDEASYQEHRARITEQERAVRRASESHASLKAQRTGLEEQVAQEAQALQHKHEKKELLVKTQQREQWLSKAFIPTTTAIEKHVLAAIHQEFSTLFTEWFSSLVEDDALHADLDETFAPRITQDGYDQSLEHLSGGEKTSVALAYRLSLNVVINDLIKSIQTTDLLILDEPTDGFSSEQLDRVRLVLTSLRCRQIIIVSHEQKMETFVDRIIRVEKHGGVSTAT